MEIKNRYCAFLEKEIIEIISTEKGFEYTTNNKYFIEKYNFLYNEKLYRLPIKDKNSVYAFRIRNFCTYKKMKFYIGNKINENLILFPVDDEAVYFIGKTPHTYAHEGGDIIISVYNTEITDIWEERTPIEGFKFDVEPIVYLKKDGVWLIKE